MRLTADPAARRRRALVAAVALCAVVAGAVVGAGAGRGPGADRAAAPQPPAAPADDDGRTARDLSLPQQVGQTVLLRFRGPALPAYVADALQANEVAGVVLFGDNVVSPAQLRRLTAEIQRRAAGGALVAADQEGGDIRVLPFAASDVGQAAQATTGAARDSARRTARDLRRAGVNVNLAPVADVPAGGLSAVRERSFPGDAGAVARLVEAAVDGHDRRVAATAKHFPGLGAATANTDDASVTIRRDAGELADLDLRPFQAAVRAGVPIVMVGHASYPGLDRERIASQSPVVLEELLRERLGFRGVAMTDSLEAEASLAVSSRSAAVAAARAIEAGADLALTTGDASYAPVLERLVRRAERSPAFRARVEQAAGRVLELKRRLGLDHPG